MAGTQRTWRAGRMPLRAAPAVASLALLLLMVRAQELPPAPDSGPVALGALSCASKGCHGNDWPVSNGRVLQNEYRTWKIQDRHARAFKVLLNDRSKRIARNLRIGEPHKASLCLDCHAYNPAPVDPVSSFDASEGVSCEVCHGASSKWLGTHLLSDRKRAALGMFDSRDIVKRSDLCLGCHLGDTSRSVDHELIAAGHPDLYFELDTMSVLMPRHWKEDESDWQGARRWATGQAVALRQSMLQLARRARDRNRKSWPEFSDFECFACHHNLGTVRADPPPGPSRLGTPRWNPSRYVVLREALLLISPDSVETLDRLVAELESHLAAALENRDQAAETATEIATRIDEIVPRVTDFVFDSKSVEDMVAGIVSRASEISHSGIRSAEQAAMALDTLSSARQSATGQADEELDTRIDQLFELVQSTSRYDPEQFARAMSEIGFARFSRH